MTLPLCEVSSAHREMSFGVGNRQDADTPIKSPDILNSRCEKGRQGPPSTSPQLPVKTNHSSIPGTGIQRPKVTGTSYLNGYNLS